MELRKFKAAMQGNMIKDCPVTIRAIEMSEDVCGPDLACLKSKTTRSKPPQIRDNEIMIPKEIYSKHRKLTLHVDTMCACGLPFLASVGWPIYYRGCVPMENTKHDSCCKAIDKQLRQFDKAGFKIKSIECDGEHRAVMDEACDGLGVTMNYTNAQDHEPRAERNNGTMKNGFRLAFPSYRVQSCAYCNDT